MNNKIFKSEKNCVGFVIFLVLAVAVMVTIFMFSSENAQDSGDTSSNVIEFFAKIIYPKFGNMTETDRQGFVDALQTVVRKTAHASIYALLGFFLCGATLQIYKPKPFIRVFTAWGIAALYSVTDEVHQYFIPGRSCEIRDMLIDSSGAALGCGAMILIWFLIKNITDR